MEGLITKREKDRHTYRDMKSKRERVLGGQLEEEGEKETKYEAGVESGNYKLRENGIKENEEMRE